MRGEVDPYASRRWQDHDLEGVRPAVVCKLDLYAVYESDDGHRWSVPVLAFDVTGAALVVEPDSGQLVPACTPGFEYVQLGPVDPQPEQDADAGTTDPERDADGPTVFEVTNPTHEPPEETMAVTAADSKKFVAEVQQLRKQTAMAPPPLTPQELLVAELRRIGEAQERIVTLLEQLVARA